MQFEGLSTRLVEVEEKDGGYGDTRNGYCMLRMLETSQDDLLQRRCIPA